MITQDDIIYFIVTDRFYNGDPDNNINVEPMIPGGFHGGDLKGIIDKVSYFKNLGVTALWITPVYANVNGFDNQRPYHYYWAKDFEKMDPRLYSGNQHEPGSKLYLADFVKVMHKNGLKVILDVVVNHGGYGIENENPKFDASWFNDRNLSVDNDPDDGNLSGLPDFNHDNVNVVDYFIHNLIDWIEVTGIDGLRMDTAFHVEKKFWYYYKSLIKGKFPNLFLVGEVLKTSKSDISTLANFQRDYDFNSVFDFPLRQQIIDCFIYDHSLKQMARPRLSNDEDYGILDLDNSTTEKRKEGNGGYSNANRLVTLLDNHDLDQRILSHARSKHQGEAAKGFAFRVVSLCYGFLLTVRGIPQLYYGSEIGLEGWHNKNAGGDADLRRDFPWNKVKKNIPKEEHKPERDLFLNVQKLIQLRRENAALKYGVMITLWVDDLFFSFLRYYKNNIVLVVFNNGYEPMHFPLDIPFIRNNNKEVQSIPDRILDAIQKGTFINAFNNLDQVNFKNDHVPVLLEEKSYKIYTLNNS